MRAGGSTVAIIVAAVLVVGVADPGEPLAHAAQTRVGPDRDAIDDAMFALYNFDFVEAHRVLDAHLRVSRHDPLGHSARAAAYLFAEFDRLQILQIDFFGNDERVTGAPRLKPDPAVREKIYASVTEARRLALIVLDKSTNDRRALFATAMAVGIEVQYAMVVEQRYIRGGSLSKELHGLAHRMLALNPPVYDAYLTLGSIEYVISNLNFVYRMLARVIGLQGTREQALEHMQIVAVQGRYYRSYAKIMLAVMHVREGRLPQARALLDELRQMYPKNALYAREFAVIDAKMAKRKNLE